MLVARSRKAIKVASHSELLPATTELHIEEASKKSSGVNPKSLEVKTVSRLSTSTPGRASSKTRRIRQSALSDSLGAITIGQMPPMLVFFKRH